MSSMEGCSGRGEEQQKGQADCGSEGGYKRASTACQLHIATDTQQSERECASQMHLPLPPPWYAASDETMVLLLLRWMSG